MIIEDPINEIQSDLALIAGLVTEDAPVMVTWDSPRERYVVITYDESDTITYHGYKTVRGVTDFLKKQGVPERMFTAVQNFEDSRTPKE